MSVQKQLYIICAITLLLLWADYSGTAGVSGMTKLPWAGDIYTEKEGSPFHLMPVLFYCVLLPLLFAVSLNGLLRLMREGAGPMQYLRSAHTAAMAVSIYIIVLFIWQSASGAAMMAEYDQSRETFKQSLERDLLLLELNEVCFLAREKMLLPDSLGGVGTKPSNFTGRETELLKTIIGPARFAALDKIMITALSDSSISIKVSSPGGSFIFDAQVFNNNRQAIYEELPVSGEVK